MFERYTEKVRRVVFFARYEASQYGSRYIDPEHLLLGLLRERSQLFQQRLNSPNSLETLRPKIESHLKIGPRSPESVEIPFSMASTHILKLAAQEAHRLSHPYVGTEHILLAILMEKKSAASRILRTHGMEIFVPQEEGPITVARQAKP